MSSYVKASESVTQGHPDVVCNIIAGSILDEAIRACLPLNVLPKIAIEVSVKGNARGGGVWIFGEVTLPKGITLDYVQIARKAIKTIGYTQKSYGFWYKTPDIRVDISSQSIEIARGVENKRTGAGDQGIMFGGAVAQEGPEYMPLPIMIAHALTTKHTQLFQSGTLPYLKPDGKAQVVIRYENGKPKEIHHITVAASYSKDIPFAQFTNDIQKYLIEPVLEEFSLTSPPKNRLVINGGGPWHIFGPLADAGTTNRKIIVDSYGGAFPHGGGGLNGKDWTKVDVSGAVGTRFLAKQLVHEKLADKVQVEVSYALGIPDPLSVHLETFGTNKVADKKIYERAMEIMSLSVGGINEKLHLNVPIYAQAAAGGWFGRKEFPWEQVKNN